MRRTDASGLLLLTVPLLTVPLLLSLLLLVVVVLRRVDALWSVCLLIDVVVAMWFLLV